MGLSGSDFMISRRKNLAGIEEQCFAHLLRSLQIGAPVDSSPIAVDALGQMDIEHVNPGPEISSEGQLTFAPYAHLSNFKGDRV
jgi:hypothetical protein